MLTFLPVSLKVYEETVVRDIDKNVGGVEDGVIDVDFLAH